MAPRFTIILTSYNGGEYLKKAVGSVLQQTYSNFTLAVLEDGSTDGSLEWLYSVKDPRITIYPSPVNRGIVFNWRRAATIERGEFMTFFAQDDVLDANFLEVVNQLTIDDPDASLYSTHFRQIDHKGNLIRSSRPIPRRETAAEYISKLFTGERDSGNSGYVMRSRLYDDVGGIPPFPRLLFADDALWIKLMMHSWKTTAAQECLSCRQHSASVGASAGITWISGAERYISFLEEMSRQDSSIARAYKAFGPGYELRPKVVGESKEARSLSLYLSSFLHLRHLCFCYFSVDEEIPRLHLF